MAHSDASGDGNKPAERSTAPSSLSLRRECSTPVRVARTRADSCCQSWDVQMSSSLPLSVSALSTAVRRRYFPSSQRRSTTPSSPPCSAGTGRPPCDLTTRSLSIPFALSSPGPPSTPPPSACCWGLLSPSVPASACAIFHSSSTEASTLVPKSSSHTISLCFEVKKKSSHPSSHCSVSGQSPLFAASTESLTALLTCSATTLLKFWIDGLLSSSIVLFPVYSSCSSSGTDIRTSGNTPPPSSSKTSRLRRTRLLSAASSALPALLPSPIALRILLATTSLLSGAWNRLTSTLFCSGSEASNSLSNLFRIGTVYSLSGPIPPTTSAANLTAFVVECSAERRNPTAPVSSTAEERAVPQVKPSRRASSGVVAAVLSGTRAASVLACRTTAVRIRDSRKMCSAE
mmetsp:Transcript_25686/g.50272  ORF Transcript_25686/g.50272 Transcript_25686/m.50272 type:complete len:402 (-) Transcript_25686:320-1525(-)